MAYDWRKGRYKFDGLRFGGGGEGKFLISNLEY